ncbi:MAG: HAMP domain-containing histidine kinase [Planctomycetes bacterium]|nr:HAMP domain-containing histidine kinase [Planctomycetota bacterium]
MPAQSDESSKEVAISLRVKAMAAAAVLIAASATAIGWSVLDAARDQMRRAHVERVDSASRATAQSLLPALLPERDVNELTRLAHAALRTSGVLLCACFDAEGELLALASVPEFEGPLRPLVAAIGPRPRQDSTLRTRRGESVALRATSVVARPTRESVPIEAAAGRAGSDVVATVVIGSSDAPVDAEHGPLQLRVWTLVAGVAAATALLAWLLARSLVRPIQALVTGTRHLADGDFAHRVDVRTRDEIALLADSFNRMTAELGESRARLARHQELLEETVRQRTRELREAYAELKVVDQLKDSFLSSISHEFRTPITSIRASAEILEQDDAMDALTRREFAGMIVAASERLGHLVDDVLEMAQLESGEMPFRFVATTPRRLVEGACAQVQAAAAARPVTLRCEVAADAPEALRCDERKLVRLLVELLRNAVRYAPEGGAVELTARRCAEGVRFDVRDDGPGIPVAELETVFEKFRQSGELLTGKPQGQGLGLALCRLIAQRHGGRVFALAEPRGAHLVVLLPLAPIAEPVARPRLDPAGEPVAVAR